MTTPIQNKANAKKTSSAYFVHKVGSQLITNVPLAVGQVFRTAAEYSVYTSRYLENNQEDIFQDKARTLYNPRTIFGKSFKKILLPSQYRQENLTSQQVRNIREQYAPAIYGHMVRLMNAGNAVAILSNAGAMYLCLKEDDNCGAQEMITFGAKAVSSSAFFAGVHLQGKGGLTMGGLSSARTPQEREIIAVNAYRHFNHARQIFILMNTAEIAGGAAKVGIEVYHALSNPDQYSGSALVDGGLHIGMGSSWLAYNSYLAREAARYAASPTTLSKGIDVLWVHARVIPPKILWSARAFGMVGPAISTGVSINDIYRGITDNSLPEKSRQRKIVSGSLGFASSLCFMGFAFFMTPASVPLGVGLFAVGLFLLAVQTAYDEWENIMDFYHNSLDLLQRSAG